MSEGARDVPSERRPDAPPTTGQPTDGQPKNTRSPKERAPDGQPPNTPPTTKQPPNARAPHGSPKDARSPNARSSDAPPPNTPPTTKQPPNAPPVYETALGASSPTAITLLGRDLAEDVMGEVGFGELAFWLAAQRRPTKGETRVFEAVLAALADHGFTPTAIVTRLTYLSAPDSVQGALAAGLLGGGSRFLGVTEDCGRFLHDVLAGVQGALPDDEAGWDALALTTVERQREQKRFVPGLGHHVHKQGDPRTPRLLRIAAEEGVSGPHLALFAAIGRVHPQVLGKTLPLNGAGVCGAALADLGLPLELLRGFALLARTAGLIGQLAEELRHPIANDVFLSVDLNNRSVAPDPYRPDLPEEG